MAERGEHVHAIDGERVEEDAIMNAVEVDLLSVVKLEGVAEDAEGLVTALLVLDFLG